MSYEIEFVKLNQEQEDTSEIVLSIKMTTFKDNPKKLKFEILMKPIRETEFEYLKVFIKDKVLNGDLETIYDYKDIKRFK